MLDVHLPHRAIDGVGEFLLHLFTITVGLLIAVGIEAAVERHQHRELAGEARETMTAEIRRNDTNVTDALADIDKEQQRLTRELADIQKVQVNPKDPVSRNLSIDISYSTTGLDDTGWRTAQATGALAFMPYAESEKFSSIYLAAQEFIQNQTLLTEDEARTLGVIRRFHIGGDSMITKDAADAMAEQFGIWQGHLFALKVTAVVLQEQQRAFLEGREAKQHMSERMSER